MNHIIAGLLLLVIVVGLLYFLSKEGFFDNIGFGGDAWRTLLGLSPRASNTEHSPDFGKVKIEFVSLGSENEDYARVMLRADFLGSAIDITGWRIETSVKAQKIPRALDLYGPGARRSLPNILVSGGNVIHLFSGVKGESARVSGGEWRIYFEDAFLGFPHDKITLRDREGRVVDEYGY